MKTIIYLALFSQFTPTNITGRIVDENNQPLTGVCVSISDGNRLYTDFDGCFSYKTRSRQDKLIKASFISYEDAFYQLDQVSNDTIQIQMHSR